MHDVVLCFLIIYNTNIEYRNAVEALGTDLKGALAFFICEVQGTMEYSWYL